MASHGPSISRRGFIGAVVAGLAAGNLAARAEGQPSPEFLDIGGEPQFFLDNWIVERMSGLKWTLHRPEKMCLIKEADGRDWERGGVYQGNTVCRDANGRFHMTYLYLWWDPGVKDLHPYIGEDRAHWFRNAVAYAWSDDGIHWNKPSLGLIDGPTGFRRIPEFPFEEPVGLSKKNNLGCPFDYIADLHASGNVHDPDKHYLLRLSRKAATHPFAETLESQVCFASAWPDFVNDSNWRAGLTPIAGAPAAPRGSVAGFDGGEWFAVGQDELPKWRARGGRDIARSSSPDLVKWSEGKLVLPIPKDESKAPTDYVEYMDILATRLGGPKSGLWLGRLVIFHGDRTDPQYMMPDPGGSKEPTHIWRKGTTELRLVCSRDAGNTWQPVGGRDAWLPCHPEDNGYDRLVFATSVVPVGDEDWHYFSRRPDRWPCTAACPIRQWRVHAFRLRKAPAERLVVKVRVLL